VLVISGLIQHVTPLVGRVWGLTRGRLSHPRVVQVLKNVIPVLCLLLLVHHLVPQVTRLESRRRIGGEERRGVKRAIEQREEGDRGK
jgi:hypothetical protein